MDNKKTRRVVLMTFLGASVLLFIFAVGNSGGSNNMIASVIGAFRWGNDNVSSTSSQSSQFAIDNKITLAKKGHIWETPSVRSKFSGDQSVGANGTIVEGPILADQAWLWKVRFDTGASGWIREDAFQRSGKISTRFPRYHHPTTSPSPLGIFDITDLRPLSNSTVKSSPVTLSGRVLGVSSPSSQTTLSINGTPLPLLAGGSFTKSLTLNKGTNNFTLLATTPNPRQQVNSITSFLDGSVVYGPDSTRALALRTMSGGKLKTSTGNLPPFNEAGLPNANDAHIFPDNELFLAGDVRANENIELSSLQTLFVREHNQIADAIAQNAPTLSDEEIYQRARRIVAAELQVVTYKEFIPALLGKFALEPYNGYRSTVNPGIANEFSTGAFRIGHTLINNTVDFLDNDGNDVRDELELAFAFFNPKPLLEVGPDPVLKYLATDNTQEVDPQIVVSLRNFLFGPPGAGGFDLAARNIQRGRDNGLADYNSVRAAYGLSRVTSFGQITHDSALAAKLEQLYGNVNNIDLWVGGLAEDHVPGTSVGVTFRKIMSDQFERVRDGDRFWYQRAFSGSQLAALEATRLSDIIRRNTTITKLQDNVFFFDEGDLPNFQPKAGSLPQALITYSRREGELTFASFDGTGNNQTNPSWGSTGIDLLRLAPAAYEDGISTPAGSNRPSARLISNVVSDQPDLGEENSPRNDRGMSDYIYAWGQFLDHDLDLTGSDDDEFDIAVPIGDPSFDPNSTGTEIISLVRSEFDPATGTSTPKTVEKPYKLILDSGTSGNGGYNNNNGGNNNGGNRGR